MDHRVDTIRRWIVRALVVAGLYFAVMGGQYTLLDLVRVRTEVRAAQRDVLDLNDRLVRIDALADSLQSSPDVLERRARERYGLIRPDEVLIRFVSPGDSTGSR